MQNNYLSLKKFEHTTPSSFKKVSDDEVFTLKLIRLK